MKVVSVATMRELDRLTIAGGTPGLTLMERAGRGAGDETLAFLRTLAPCHRRRASVLAGKGNNGGDAYVVARHLAQAGIPTVVYAVCPPADLTGEARLAAEGLPPTVAVEVCGAALPPAALTAGSFIVDGLLGTGISGPLRPPCPRWIEQVNASGLPVVCLDIPSGLCGDTGQAAGPVVQADLTVTMGLPKAGLLSESGLRLCGRLRCLDIGLDADAVENAPSAGQAVFAADVRAWLPRRPADGHKGTFGHVLIVGGSADYTGAPVLAGAAALRGGCGLVILAVPAAIRATLRGLPQALIVRPVADGGGGFFGDAGLDDLRALAAWPQALLAGPGIGNRAAHAGALREILSWPVPAVIDADALRTVAANLDWLRRDAATVLTPHPGEMRALLGGAARPDLVGAPRHVQAVELARRTGAIVVLKGLGTVTAAPDGAWHLNTSGHHGLGSGGTGDVLGGLIGSLLAQGLSALHASLAGVFLHGLAAELAPTGARALIADDLPALIGEAFRTVTPFA
ncbi:MAG: Bifunctional NAD(P)H-hydrate repair enzyme Nnr [Lentisphaerae bacterium ADurb.BinA184]|nr:MAG: Bifunctional NAD(P)H-hydrate repair enzyme Nnr [Lentisphaerae bacterium ADurb.BinA184]